MNGPIFSRLLSASVAAANHAGKLIREIMKTGNLGIVDKKGLNDLQTEADRSAQRSIVNSLQLLFPKVTIIGEETREEFKKDEERIDLSSCDNIQVKCPDNLASLKEEEIVVWVDPLDGTKEYTQGLLDHVTVLIGVAVNGKAVGGVVHQPYFNYQNEPDVSKLGRTMWGVVGGGSGGITRVQPPPNKRIIVTTRSHSNELVNATIEAMKPDEVIRVGGAGHKILLLIEGKAHAYVFPSNGTKKWDTCAPEALLHSFGGKLTDLHGRPLQYHAEVQHPNSAGVLATYQESEHEGYVANVPSRAKEALA